MAEAQNHIVGVDLAGAEVQEKTLHDACKEVEKQGISVRYYSTEAFSPSCSVSTQVISMDDDPFSFRRKPDATLVCALQDLAKGKISSLVTCANTGAVVSAATIYLGKFHSLRRPALLAIIPLNEKRVLVLDSGAFVEARVEDLVSYASLGAHLALLHLGLSSPRVGLLNIGKEPKKGTTELQHADEALSKKSSFFSYVGFVEPFDVFSGEVDVLVTNGFVGNIFLKTAEGIAALLSTSNQRARKEIPSLSSAERDRRDVEDSDDVHSVLLTRNDPQQIDGHSQPNREDVSLRALIDRNSHGGAILVGVKHPLIKCHGKPSASSFMNAVFQASDLAMSGLISQLEHIPSCTKGL